MAGQELTLELKVRREPPGRPKEREHERAPPKLAQLGAAEIQKILVRGRGSVMMCFEDHKAQLPAEHGQVTFGLTILGSGRVGTVGVTGDFAGSAVGRCVEQQVSKLRFPANLDSEISLNSGYEYRVQR